MDTFQLYNKASIINLYRIKNNLTKKEKQKNIDSKKEKVEER